MGDGIGAAESSVEIYVIEMEIMGDGLCIQKGFRRNVWFPRWFIENEECVNLQALGEDVEMG